MTKQTWKAIFVMFFAIYLTGCSAIGLLFSKSQSFTAYYYMDIRGKNTNIIDIASEVGKSLGYTVSNVTKEISSISLERNESLFNEIMIGKIQTVYLDISSENNGKKLNIIVKLFANFGDANQETANQYVEEFKAKLIEKIGA